MKKEKLLPLLLIAFIVAIASTGIVYGLFSGKLRDTANSSAKEHIAVAAHNLSKGATLTAADVKLAPWPAANQPKGAFVTAEVVLGQTLLESLQENEPLTQFRLASRKTGGTSGVPAGMRAVSVRVTDSPGVVGLLRSGHKVDVQFVGTRQGSPEIELRTVLQNMEVLAINPQADNIPNRAGTTVVTLLASPSEADVLSLADTNGRLRLLLRNPIDEERLTLQTVSLGSLVHQGTAAPASAARPILRVSAPATQTGPRVAPVAVQTVAPPEPRVTFSVKFAGVQPDAASELSKECSDPASPDSLRVSAVKREANLEAMLKAWEGKQQMSVLQASQLTAASNREVSVQAMGKRSEGSQSGGDFGVSLSLRTMKQSNGQLRLRIQPEVRAPQSGLLNTRRLATELDLQDGQSFVITGLGGGRQALLERLFTKPGEPAPSGELILIVTPHVIAPLRPATGAML